MNYLLTPEQRHFVIDALALRRTEDVEVSELEAFYYTAQYESLQELDDEELLERAGLNLEDLR
jgi:hypothetical protein